MSGTHARSESNHPAGTRVGVCGKRWLAGLALCCVFFKAGPALATATVLQLEYDAVGNVKTLTTPKGASTYQYNALNRLTNEAGPAGTQAFVYDGNGNRVQDGGGTLTYPAASNRLATRYNSPSTNAYDAAGRTLSDDGLYTYTYGVRGRLKTVKLKATSALIATYYYDYRNRRTRKVTVSPASTTVYHYDQFDRLIGESTVSGGAAQAGVSYLYNESVPVAQVQHGGTEKVNYLHSDQLGTPRVARDAQRKVVWRWDSNAYGSTLASTDPDRDGSATSINLRFAGQYFDGESGLHYNHHRNYVPKTGRYLQSDPIGLAGGINTYAYVDNNPTRWTDPKGLSIWRRGRSDFTDQPIGSGWAPYFPDPTNGSSDAAGECPKPINPSPFNPDPADPLQNPDPRLAGNTGSPASREAQQKGFDAVVRILDLSKTQRQLLHREITGMNYDFHEILRIGSEIKAGQ